MHYDFKAGFLAIAIAATLAVVMILRFGSEAALDATYEDTFGGTTVLRNEWGQLRHTPEFMCEVSIRQWLKECGK